jgi:Tol biopolymer transport system component
MCFRNLILLLLVPVVGCDLIDGGKEWTTLQPKLVFTMRDTTVGPLGIYTMNLDGSSLNPVAVVGDSIGSFVIHTPPALPRWSPNGKMIVCQITQMIDLESIILMNADGTDKRFLRPGALRPQWSPEGDRILFERHIYLGAVIGSYIIDVSGENEREFKIKGETNPYIYEGDSVWFTGDYQWGPNGTLIYGVGSVNKKPDQSYIIGSNPYHEIFSFDSYSGEVLQRLTNNYVDEGGFLLSPDRNRVAYRRGKYNKSDNKFYILNLTSGEVDSISLNAHVDIFFNWSSDGKKLVYGLDENTNPYYTKYHLYLLDLNKPDKRIRLTQFQAEQPDLFIPIN